jgi:hypothetical protein
MEKLEIDKIKPRELRLRQYFKYAYEKYVLIVQTEFEY